MASTKPAQQIVDAEPAKWSVYIVAGRGDYWYTGISTDVGRRFAEHQGQGGRCARALRGRGPLRLLFNHEVGSHGAALRMECYIKRLSKVQKRALVAGKAALPLG